MNLSLAAGVSTASHRLPPAVPVSGAIAAGLITAILPVELLLGIVTVILGVWAGAKRPDIALGLVAASIPIQTAVHLDVGLGRFTVTKVIVWTTLAGWLWAQTRSRRTLRVDPVTIALLLTTAAILFSGWNAVDGGLWIGEVYRWAIAVPVALMAFATYSSGGSIRPLIVACASATVITTSYAVWQVVENIGPPSFESRGLMRATGPFSHPNQLALYLETTTPLLISVAVLLFMRHRRQSGQCLRSLSLALAGIGAAAGVLGILLSQSRGGGAGMAASLAVIFLLWTLLENRSITGLAVGSALVFVLGVTAAVLVIASGAVTVSSREILVTPANFAVEERVAHWVAGVRMAVENPYLGIGGGNYDRNFRNATDTWRYRIGRGHAHNSPIQLLAQAGIAGYFAYLVLISVVTVTAARAVDSARNVYIRAIAIGVTGVTVAVVVHGLFEYVHVLSISLQLSILWGLTSAMAWPGGGPTHATQSADE